MMFVLLVASLQVPILLFMLVVLRAALLQVPILLLMMFALLVSWLQVPMLLLMLFVLRCVVAGTNPAVDDCWFAHSTRLDIRARSSPEPCDCLGRAAFGWCGILAYLACSRSIGIASKFDCALQHMMVLHTA